jgi:hypothetical protein
MENLIMQLEGRTEPVKHECYIAVTHEGESVLVSSKPSLLDTEIFDGIDVQSNVSNPKDIPSKPGLYSCQIEVSSYRCNIPEDPEEWDMTLTLENPVWLLPLIGSEHEYTELRKTRNGHRDTYNSYPKGIAKGQAIASKKIVKTLDYLLSAWELTNEEN